MAAVNDYLKKLLYQYDCVVVPELGAFLTHYQPASFTEASGLYLPPRKRVAFNEALRLDDGILANYIMLHEPVTREGAQRHISLFVQELRQHITASGQFDLDGIGVFTRNDEDRLQFDPSLRHNFFGEAYGMSALSAQLVHRQPAPSIEAVPITAVGPVLSRDSETTFEPHRPARPYWRIAATALLVSSLGLISYFSVLKPGHLQSSLDPANLFRLPALSADRPVTRPDVAKAAPTRIPVAKPVPVPTTGKPATTVPAPVVIPARVSKPMPVTTFVARPLRTGPHFTVIAGSFASKGNALRLRRQLRRAGYADAFIIPPAARGQLYKVAAIGSADRTQALASMAAVNDLAHTSAWIFKR